MSIRPAMYCLGVNHHEKGSVEGDLLVMWFGRVCLGGQSHRWTTLGTQLLSVADVCSKGQGDGDHVRTGGLDSTSVVALWYFGWSGALPAWGLM